MKKFNVGIQLYGVRNAMAEDFEGTLSEVKEKYPDAILIMLLPPSFKVQEERLRGRGTETEEKILKRLEQTRRELPLVHEYDYIVFNEDGKSKDAADDIFSIVRSEKLASSRKENIEKLYFEN